MGGIGSRISGKISIQAVLALVFGVVFLILILFLAIAIPNPTQFQYFIFRVLLALAAGGCAGAVFNGVLKTVIPPAGSNIGTATGGFAVFVIVLLINPPELISPQQIALTPEPAAVPTSVVSIRPSDTPTPTQTQTEAPAIPPTFTTTATPTPTITVPPPTKLCLLADIWHTNIPNPPRDSAVPELLRLDRWGFYEMRNSADYGFSINKTSDVAANNGIFLIPYEQSQNYHVTMTFKVAIADLRTTADCGGDYRNGSCAVNLIMGIGNPIGPDMETENGKYVIFRDLDGIDGWICKAGSIYGESGNCRSPMGESLDDMVRIHKNVAYQIKFDLNGSLLNVELNDGQEILSYYNNEILDEKYEKFLWIGYNFRSGGKINTFITCPEIN
jgi:hypothetical protein